MARIFISYRRRDSAYVASNLRDALQVRFGANSVFLDIENIPFGADFRQFIGNAVGQCDVLLVLIGDQWLQLTDDQGRRRIENPSDYVRIEIESALKRDIQVVPVLVGEAKMPAPSELPKSIRDIAFRNAAEIRATRDQKHQIERLVSGLAEHLRANVSGVETEKPAKSTAAIPQSELDRRAAFMKKVHQAFDDITHYPPWFSGAIPPEKAIAATEAYAPNVSQDAIMLLFDGSLFGTAKAGFLLTVDAIYWHNLWGEWGQCRYADIQKIELMQGAPVRINGKKEIITPEPIAEAVTNLIRSLKPELQTTESVAAELTPAISQSELDRRAAFLEQVRKAFDGIPNDPVWFGGEVPPEKAMAATKSYAPNVAQDAILLLHDETMLGGAKDGVLLTVDAIYWHNMWAEAGYCRYADVKSISVEKDGLGNTKLRINDKEFYVSKGPPGKIAEALMNLIRGLNPELAAESAAADQ